MEPGGDGRTIQAGGADCAVAAGAGGACEGVPSRRPCALGCKSCPAALSLWGTCSCNMTLEEFSAGEQKTERMDKVGDALEEVLSKALSQRTITVGVYEAAKLLNVDPDNVVLCLLAADEDDDRDVALQIHFTLIQAFCCENDINILRVSNPGRLAKLLLLETDASPGASEGAEQPSDLHCVLVTNPHSSQWKDPALSQLICFCRESRYMDQWVPVINLPER